MSTSGVLFIGATGFIGPHVVRALRSRGDTIWVWARNVGKARRNFDASVNVVGADSALT